MARCGLELGSLRFRFPHPRGDGPGLWRKTRTLRRISPPAWGWPVAIWAVSRHGRDFPTRVGMARPSPPALPCSPRFPHPRGDGPVGLWVHRVTVEISPPAWGWPAAAETNRQQEEDFPTRVGMARQIHSSRPRQVRFPHPRGDGPLYEPLWENTLKISPPAWGWPVMTVTTTTRNRDFPTRVGMARRLDLRGSTAGRFPHPRGDGPV